MSAAGRNSKPASWTISTGWDSLRICIRPSAFGPHAATAGRATANRSTGKRCDRLVRDNLVYACDCSRRTLAGHATNDELQLNSERRYPGTCRDRGLPVRDGYGWRVRIDDSVEEFDDALLGRQVQKPLDQCGDILIRDRLGNWTYQFAATVDDYWQDIDLVIRGVDLLESTGRQIQLARLLGRPAPPTYMHHPLIMKSADQKLSKSDRDTGIRDLRAAGWSRERIFAEVERRHR